MLNPIIGNLHNTGTNRYHPILFREHPLPGGNGPTRHKSVGHHTAGFDSRDESIDECRKMAERQYGRLCISKDFAWDGDDMPAMVVYFRDIDGEVVPAI